MIAHKVRAVALFFILLVPAGTFAQPTEAMPQDAMPQDAVHAGLGGGGAQLTTQTPSSDVPKGTIDIAVEGDGLAVSNLKIELAIMNRDSSRDSKTTTTDAQGHATFSGLGTGTAQAYRVNLLHDGAKTSSTPFRLEDDRGMRVSIKRLPVSDDGRFIVARLARVGLGLREGRIRVTEQLLLMNLSDSIYKFPEEGLLIEVPEERLSFRSEKNMSDQRLVEQPDGVRVFGSIAPGQATLLWDFDMPVDDPQFELSLKLPFPTMNLSVEADGAPGATLSVDGFVHETIEHEEQGRHYLIAQHRQIPGKDKLIETLKITYAGLPGPGPTRWIAATVASIFVLLGLGLALRRRETVATESGTTDELLAEVKVLESEKAAGEIGPEYYARRRRELTDALANALRQQAQ